MACPARFGDVSLIAVRPAAAFAEAGFRRWATYRQAAVAGVFVNTVFGVIKLSMKSISPDWWRLAKRPCHVRPSRSDAWTAS